MDWMKGYEWDEQLWIERRGYELNEAVETEWSSTHWLKGYELNEEVWTERRTNLRDVDCRVIQIV